MHTENIGLLKQEAQRIIALEIEFLKRMLEEEGVLIKNKDSEQSFSLESAKNYIEMLEEEVIKVSNLEMVLAIVGTMKAGKSTSINAIVGLEVLPNRNMPMTALPTLIRHVKGQKTPRLSMHNYEPINKLIGSLKKYFNEDRSRITSKKFTDDSDMKSLVDYVLNIGLYNKEYLGSPPMSG